MFVCFFLYLNPPPSIFATRLLVSTSRNVDHYTVDAARAVNNLDALCHASAISQRSQTAVASTTAYESRSISTTAASHHAPGWASPNGNVLGQQFNSGQFSPSWSMHPPLAHSAPSSEPNQSVLAFEKKGQSADKKSSDCESPALATQNAVGPLPYAGYPCAPSSVPPTPSVVYTHAGASAFNSATPSAPDDQQTSLMTFRRSHLAQNSATAHLTYNAASQDSPARL